jgi:hypothetical protein
MNQPSAARSVLWNQAGRTPFWPGKPNYKVPAPKQSQLMERKLIVGLALSKADLRPIKI